MTQVHQCGCYHCASGRTEPLSGLPETMTRMIVCPVCGNKRCPRATHHDNECTGSNEPDQPGSRYTFAEWLINISRRCFPSQSKGVESVGPFETPQQMFEDDMKRITSQSNTGTADDT